MAMLPPLRDRVVRDLWWAVTSPGFASAGSCPLVPPFDAAALLPLFTALDTDPLPLHRAVAGSLDRDRLRLGAYFEDLIQFHVEHLAGHRDVLSSVVIYDNKRTVGELDLLFRDQDSCHHWEMAVKFYLHVPALAPDPGECFLGPQTQDRLHIKLTRVQNHQLPMATHPAAASATDPWQPLNSAALLRGRLFYPASQNWDAGLTHPSIAPDHLRGWWCPVDRCDELLPHADSYALLTRRDWLAPIDATWDPVTRWSRQQLCAWSANALATWPAGVTQSHVVAGLDPDGREINRGFLVSTSWPGDERVVKSCGDH